MSFSLFTFEVIIYLVIVCSLVAYLSDWSVFQQVVGKGLLVQMSRVLSSCY